MLNDTTTYIDDKVMPHLMALHESRELYTLAKDKSVQSRTTLTNLVSDLIQENLSDNEKELVADILIDLTRQAYTDIRIALAEKLADIPQAPERLVLHLAHDEIDVAQHILARSSVLTDNDLLYIIEAKTAEYWKAISKRKSLSETVMNALADTKDHDTFCTLAKNNHVEFTSYTYNAMQVMARRSERLAIPLLTRPDVPRELAMKLYHHVGASLKSYIQDKFGKDIAEQTVKPAIDKIIEKKTNFMPSKTVTHEAAESVRQGLISKRTIIDSLRHGKISDFVAQFAAFNDIDVETTAKILKENTGRLLACTCHDKEIHRSDFVAIFLMTHKIRNKQSIVPLDDIQTAMRYYDNIKPKLAKQIMMSIRSGVEI